MADWALGLSLKKEEERAAVGRQKLDPHADTYIGISTKDRALQPWRQKNGELFSNQVAQQPHQVRTIAIKQRTLHHTQEIALLLLYHLHPL